jgi:monoamine oxidase
MNGKGKRVLVIGAGMAGLTAARKLAEAHRHVMVLEARNRVGGRIFTLRERNEVLELGAEFIHGRPPELWRLIQEADLETYQVDGTHVCHKDGKIQKCDEQESTFKFLEALESWKGPDIGFADYPPLKDLSPDHRAQIISYVQSFNAADYRQISVHALAVQQRAEEEVEGGTLFRVRLGYDQVPEFLAHKTKEAGGRIELSMPVERIEWHRGQVQVFVRDGGDITQYTAEQAIIALPLGVLQDGSITFQPTPGPVIQAADLRMGPARRFTLLFRERFWAERESINLPKLSFLFAHDAMPPVWWTDHPVESHTITGWIGGPQSTAFDFMTPEEIGAAACKELSRVFSLPAEYLQTQLIRCATHDWQTDCHSCGTYSYVPAGQLETVLNLVKPVEDTLFFAGEHTDTTGHWGTVHAAMRSGLRAAGQILAATRS